jgi:hypothetical protein
VYYRLAELSVEFLQKQLGISVHDEVGTPGINFRSYGRMGHASCKQEMNDLAAFLENVIPKVC